MTAALAAAVLCLPGAGVASADPEPAVTAADLPRLQAELAQVTAQAQLLADRLDEAAARDGGLRVAMERLAETQDAAPARLGSPARVVYMRHPPHPPLTGLNHTLPSTELPRIAHAGGQ